MKFIMFLSFFAPCVVFAQTLCKKEETDFFSCKTTNHKIISICGKITDNEIDNESWIQYRFGRLDNLELIYPKDKKNSVAKFEGNWFDRYNFVDLRFINGDAAYSVSLNGTFYGEDADKREKVSGGVDVKLRTGARVSIYCVSPNTNKYFEIFARLNSTLRAHNGDTDIFYKEKMY